MPNQHPPSKPHSFTLRCWQEDGDADQHPAWRFSVTSAETNQRKGFASLSQLIDWMCQESEE